MSEPSDMSTPVTRNELHLELKELDRRVDQKLETWAGAVNARIDSIAKRSAQLVGSFEQRIGQLIAELVASSEQRTAERIASQGRELHDDLARHSRAMEESVRRLFSVLDDKYSDLPGRVTALERNGSAPPASPRKRRRRAS